jgi:hypothetical protein
MIHVIFPLLELNVGLSPTTPHFRSMCSFFLELIGEMLS